MYKSNLYELCQRKAWDLLYETNEEGPSHNPRFKSTVTVNGVSFDTPDFCKRLKKSENEAARIAYLHFATDSNKPPVSSSSGSASGVSNNLYIIPPIGEVIQPNIKEKLETPQGNGNSSGDAYGALTGLPHELMHKNRLQDYTQQSSIKLPIYQTINEGVEHAPKFRATVLVDGARYTSSNTFSHRKAAEQDVAKLALACIQNFNLHPGLPDELMHKNRLQHYTQQSSIKLPIYQTVNEGVEHAPKFRATVLVDGAIYTSSNTFSHRKAAEQDVARHALACITKKIQAEGCRLISEGCTKNSSGISNRKEVEGSNILLPIEISDVCSGQVINPLVVPQPFHEFFKTPKKYQNPGNSGGISLGKGKEVEGTNTLPPLAISVACSGEATNHPAFPRPFHGIPLSIGKEVVGTPTLLPIAVSEACSGQVTNHPVLYQPIHEFKTPKKELSEAIALPIAFMLPILQQPLGAASSSSKKRNRKNKKRGNKKSRMDAK